jgi:hypothetical protein
MRKIDGKKFFLGARKYTSEHLEDAKKCETRPINRLGTTAKNTWPL